MKKIVLMLCLYILSACSSLQVAQLDPKTGLFPSNKKATVVVSKPLDLDKRKELILVFDDELQKITLQMSSTFGKNQIQNIGYFDKVITSEDLETIIVKNNLGDKVSSVRSKIGVNNAAKYYKPFLWFRIYIRGSGNQKYVQFILTDPLTLEDYFVTEKHLDFILSEISDQSHWYPMFNSFIKYIKENSKTY